MKKTKIVDVTKEATCGEGKFTLFIVRVTYKDVTMIYCFEHKK